MVTFPCSASRGEDGLKYGAWTVVPAVFSLLLVVSGAAMTRAVEGQQLLPTQTPSSPQPKSQKALTAVGEGVVSCADFNSANKAVPDRTGNFFSWTQGFLSGLDQKRAAEGSPPINLAFWSVLKQGEFIREYCAAHPRNRYGDAVVALFDELEGQQGISPAR
jgi:hypothetical protein